MATKAKDKATPNARTVSAKSHRSEEQTAQRIAELRKTHRAAVGYATTFTFDMPGDEVSGKIIDYREGVGQYESGLIVLERPEGEQPRHVSVWLGADLGMKITREHIGSFVTIIYVEDIDTGMGNPMRAYEVFFT